MSKTELSPMWVHGGALAICFFGWIGLTLFFDGIADRQQAIRAITQATLFTSLIAGVDLGIYSYRRYSDQDRSDLAS